MTITTAIETGCRNGLIQSRTRAPHDLAPFFRIGAHQFGEFFRRAARRFVADRSETLAKCRRDRKSTRLNSSHLGISYAVFCLKKKKTIEPNSITYRDPHSTQLNTRLR